MSIRSLARSILGFTVLLSLAATIHAAEIRVLASNGVKAALEELAPAFERKTGHKLDIEFGVAAPLIQFLSSPAAGAVFKSKGQEPG